MSDTAREFIDDVTGALRYGPPGEEDTRKLAAALTAVLDLHQPEDSIDGWTLCSVCAEADDCAYALPWPCPTVQAIDKATQVEA